MENQETHLIYRHTSPSGKSYIGLTSNYHNRSYAHKYDAACGSNLVFHKAIRKYGWDSFKHEIVADNLTKEEACKLEVLLIKELNTQTPDGYNVSSGGESGWSVSDETKAEMAEATRRRHGNYSGVNRPTDWASYERKDHPDNYLNRVCILSTNKSKYWFCWTDANSCCVFRCSGGVYRTLSFGKRGRCEAGQHTPYRKIFTKKRLIKQFIDKTHHYY